MIPPHLILEACTRFGVDREDLLSYCRYPHLVRARWWLWTELHDLGWSYSRIARATARDHTSIMHGVKATREIGRVAKVRVG